MDHLHTVAFQTVGAGAPDATAHARATVGLAPAGAAAGVAPAGAAAGLPPAGAATTGVDARLASSLSSPSATAAASTRAADLVPFRLGLPGYSACTGALTSLLSPTRLPRQPPLGFSTTRPLVADATWASTTLSTDSTMSSAIAAIQAALAASQERERAVSCALEQERALAATLTAQMATAQCLVIGPPPVTQETPPPTPEAPHASGLDANHIAALHAQVAGLQNIRSLVSVVLDPASSHYPRWRGQVLLTLWLYALDDHVLDDVATPLSPAWSLMDFVVLSWLPGTITVELQDIIRNQADTGRQAWLALEEQFLENRDASALHLDAQFHLFSQGDLSVDEYCRQKKGMADSFRDVREPVADRTLMLNLLCGLSPRYGHLKALIKRTVPFPTFHAVRNELILEELTIVSKAAAPAPTLYSAPPGGQAPSGGHAPCPPSTGAPTRPTTVVLTAPR
jgi:hypothetical protein